MVNKLAVAGKNSRFKQPEAEPAGFWAGFWHGNIAPLTFVTSLFNKDVSIYETHNNGAWYNFGFLLGISSVLGPKVSFRVETDSKKSADNPEECCKG